MSSGTSFEKGNLARQVAGIEYVVLKQKHNKATILPYEPQQDKNRGFSHSPDLMAI